MKIGIISDTHGDFTAWQRAWDLVLNDADMIFHCGDILYHGPRFDPGPGHGPRKIATAINALTIPSLFVKGNGDSEVDTRVINLPIQSPYTLAQIGDRRFLCTHGHLTTTDELIKQAARWKIDYVLTGHTHVPVLRNVNGVTHLNPGSTTYPLANEAPLRVPTCACIENDIPTIFNLETGAPLQMSNAFLTGS